MIKRLIRGIFTENILANFLPPSTLFKHLKWLLARKIQYVGVLSKFLVTEEGYKLPRHLIIKHTYFNRQLSKVLFTKIPVAIKTALDDQEVSIVTNYANHRSLVVWRSKFKKERLKTSIHLNWIIVFDLFWFYSCLLHKCVH